MRIQFFAFCDRAELTPSDGYNLYGVGGEQQMDVKWTGPPTVPLLPFKKTLMVGFVEGSEGQHRTWLLIQPPEGASIKSSRDWIFSWPTKLATHSFSYELDLHMPALTGIWEFQIFVDNEPLGVALLPMHFDVMPPNATVHS